MSRIVVNTAGIDGILGNIKFAKKETLDEIGERVVNRAQELVPVDTGFLQSSIRADNDGDTLTIAADADYASFVELGTSKMAAQPYLGPAMLEVRRQIPLIMGKSIVKAAIGKVKRLFG